MSQDNYVVVKQELIPEEEKTSYSSLGYFSTQYESEWFCRGKICDEGDVLYVCDTAKVVDLPDSAVFAFVATKYGHPKMMDRSSLSNLIYWFGKHHSAGLLLGIAFFSNVPFHMIRNAACECVKSMTKYTEDANEFDNILNYIQTIQEFPMTGDIGTELKAIKRKMEGRYLYSDPSSSCIAKSILYILETTNGSAVENLNNMNLDTSHMPYIVKRLIPDNVFLTHLVMR